MNYLKNELDCLVQTLTRSSAVLCHYQFVALLWGFSLNYGLVRHHNVSELLLFKTLLALILEWDLEAFYLKYILIHAEETIVRADMQLFNATLRPKCPVRHC